MPTKKPSVVLETGDRLTRDEFHRRYCLRPDIKKAELVEGVVYVASPLRADLHGMPHADAIYWLRHYSTLVSGVAVADNATVMLDEENEVQPDVCLFRTPPPDDNAARLRSDGYIAGPPQLVVEIAASSAPFDLGAKLRAYQQARVPEYVVWQVIESTFYWFELRSRVYERVQPDERGILESSQFPGLRLHVAKMLAGDMAGVLAEIRAPS